VRDIMIYCTHSDGNASSDLKQYETPEAAIAEAEAIEKRSYGRVKAAVRENYTMGGIRMICTWRHAGKF
jgi:hypothetical protein